MLTKLEHYYRVGEQSFHWIWDTESEMLSGYNRSSLRSGAREDARNLAEKSGLPLELRRRELLEDDGRSPRWDDQLVQIITPEQRRLRLTELAS